MSDVVYVLYHQEYDKSGFSILRAYVSQDEAEADIEMINGVHPSGEVKCEEVWLKPANKVGKGE